MLDHHSDKQAARPGRPGLHFQEGGAKMRHRWSTSGEWPKVGNQRKEAKVETIQNVKTQQGRFRQWQNFQTCSVRCSCHNKTETKTLLNYKAVGRILVGKVYCCIFVTVSNHSGDIIRLLAFYSYIIHLWFQTNKCVFYLSKLKPASLLPKTERGTKSWSCSRVAKVSIFLFKVRDVDYSGIKYFD